jgi:uncharacterized protein (TIGR00297 family)
MSDHATNELLRKSLHIGFGLVAFSLKLMPWWAAAGMAAVAIAGNWLGLHRIVGRSVARHERGFDAGIVLYPIAVLVLILVFRNQLHYAAIAWALLAFGDGVATLAGQSFGIARLPWNRDKSWGGFLGFLIFGGAGAFAVAYWMDYRAPLAIVVTTLAAAIAESLPDGIDDNVTVPFAAGVALVIAGIQPVHPFAVWPDTGIWLVANAALALAGYFARSVNFSGALGGWFLGAIILLGAGWPLYVALLAFFVIGTAATKLGYARKAAAGLAQERGGRRGFSHAFSNAGVAAICAIAVSRLARSTQGMSEVQLIPFFMGVASLATAAADTTASEIGQLLGKRAFLPVTLKRVPVGTEGAISIEGTLAGLLAAFLVAAASLLSVQRMFGDVVRFSWWIVLAVTLCAFAGSYLESLAGSWNRKRMSPIPNGVLNFFNTAVGALLMGIAWQVLF